MKWLIAAVVAAFLAVFVYLQLHSVKTSYINGLAPYTNLPGRGFILEQGLLYIFKFKAPTRRGVRDGGDDGLSITAPTFLP